MDPTHDPQEPSTFTAQPIPRRKIGIWANIGGGPLTIAIIVHLVLLVAGAFLIIQQIQPARKDPDITPPGGGGSGSASAEHQVKQKKAQARATDRVKRTFAEGAKSLYATPDMGDAIGEMTSLVSLAGGGGSGGIESLGNGGGLGSGRGPGVGSGLFPGLGGNAQGRFTKMIPGIMGKRCSREDRLQRLKDNGGTPECEEAVVRGLRWLKENQNSDGSWGSSRKVAMTGLALLTYFGHCETTISEEFGDSCTKGIVYLVNQGLMKDGRLASNHSEKSWCYEHAIATYALGEAATFNKELKEDERIPSLMEVTQKAGQFIIDNQNTNGGWAYSYDLSEGHTDVSVTGWQVQALRACEHSGVKLSGTNGTITKALKYLDSCQNENGGYGYSGKNPPGEVSYFTLTGVGMLCNQMWGKGARSEVRRAAKYVTANSRFDYNSEYADLYGHYYESQAMMQSGGTDWATYNALFRDQVLKNQNADGSWKSPGGGTKLRAVAPAYVGESGDAKVYRTTLCSLMLEVYYRFLSTGGGHGTKSRLDI